MRPPTRRPSVRTVPTATPHSIAARARATAASPSGTSNELRLAAAAPRCDFEAVGPDAPACDSVTAEIVPHFRPDSWLALATLNGSNASTVLRNLRLDRALRFTGQLIFDASHMPCTNGRPAREAPAP